MSLEMVRIDDRFIHGQVVIGWCPHVKPDRLILCDDEIATNDWEREIYEDAAMEYTTSIYTVNKTIELLRKGSLDREKLFLIVNSPSVLVKLVQAGVEIKKAIVGGMHYESGKRKITDFIYINNSDLNDFRFLVQHDVILEGKDLPGCKSINMAKKLGLG